MKGHISRESWSRCEQPSMLYDTVRNPNARYIPPKPVMNTGKVDTIESTQQRLNRQMLERLRNIGLQLPHDSFVAVVQVGKYVFLAIMLPPYLLLYGIPRWLLVTLIPQIFDQGKAVMMTIGKYAAIMSKHVADLMKGILDQLLGDAMRMMRDSAQSFQKGLSNLFRKIADAISLNSTQLQEWQDRLTTAFARKSGDLAGMVQKGFQYAQHKLIEGAKSFAETVAKVLTTAGEYADRAVLTPMINFLAPPVQAIGRAVAFVADKTSKYMEAARAFAARQAEKIAAPARDAAEWVSTKVKKAYETIAEPVADWLKKRIEAVEEQVRRAKEKVVDPAVEAAVAVKNHVADALSATFDIAKQALLFVPFGIVRTLKRAGSFVPQRTRDRMKQRKEAFQRFGKGVKSLAQGVSSGVRMIGRGVKAGCSKAASWVLKLRHALVRMVKWLIAQLMLLPRRLWRALKVVGRFVRKVSGGLAIGIRLFIAVLWAAGYFGFSVLRRAVG